MSKFRRSFSGSGSFGSWTAAVVQFNKEKNLFRYVPILTDGSEDTGSAKILPAKAVPENLFPGKHIIQLSEDKKQIMKFRPYSGQFPAKFSKFSSREGEQPSPKLVRGEYGEYAVFTPLFEIVSGGYKGTIVSYRLNYLFREGDDGVTEFSSTKGMRLAQLEEFLDTCLGIFDPPKWSDNLLPLFEKHAQKANRTVGLIIKKGYVDSIVELHRPDME